jgi:hypothetical protein
LWVFEGKEFTSNQIGNCAGYVYLLTDRETGRRYIGKKTFWFRTTLPPLKGAKRKRKKVVESDWLDYYGSNKEIQKLVAEHGRDRFSREILHLCRTKSEMSYLEAKLQFEYGVLLSDEWFNDMIMCRVSGRQIRG